MCAMIFRIHLASIYMQDIVIVFAAIYKVHRFITYN